MPKIAWARKAFNAYNAIKKGDNVYDTENNLIGVANGVLARATATSDGSVNLTNNKWVSGKVEKIKTNGETTDWKTFADCKIS